MVLDHCSQVPLRSMWSYKYPVRFADLEYFFTCHVSLDIAHAPELDEERILNLDLRKAIPTKVSERRSDVPF